MPDSECPICSMEKGDPASRVFLDELWAAEVAPGYEVPGWFFLRARRRELITAGRTFEPRNPHDH